jgi:cytoskeleton protein RodZ
MTIHDTQEDRPDEYPDQPEGISGMSAKQDLAPVTNLRPTVGDELRMRREEAGHSIADVSEATRVQKRYLEALESGRLENLPGTVYALGFLRTYAEYYGFNGGEFITRFKEETAGQRREQDFSLPEPIEEARVPTAAIVIVAIVLAIGAYVAWHSLRPQEAEISGAVPEVPAYLATAPEEASPATAPGEIVIAPGPAVTAPVEPVAAPPAAMAVSPEEPVAAEAPAAITEPETPLAEPEIPAADAPPAETPPAVEVVTVTPPETPETDTPSAPMVEETPYTPQTFGAGSVDGRIVITAAEDSWIEVADAEGERLFSRTMRAGDSYRVPNREGLVFVTGNAGGLKITVDGAATPPIGETGIVRKNVKLDPELLKQGRAWP